MSGAERDRTAEAKPRDQNTGHERGQGKEDKGRKSHREEKVLGAQTEAARQRRAAPPAIRNEESSTCA